MIYLDSNVFVYAGSDGGVKGKAAAKVLTASLEEGACTASLALDEVLWVLSKKRGRKVAALKTRQLLALDLEVLDVGRVDVEAALDLFDAGLDPRDSIHAAVALRAGCRTIVSSDPAFAAVKGLKHVAY